MKNKSSTLLKLGDFSTYFDYVSEFDYADVITHLVWCEKAKLGKIKRDSQVSDKFSTQNKTNRVLL